MAVAIILVARRGRLGGVSLPEPVVVDADRLELAATSMTPSSSPSGSPASSSPPSSCSWPIASSASATGRDDKADYEPENKRLEWWLTVVTARRRRRHAGARPVRLAPVRHRAGGCDRGRGGRPAMAVELPPARQGRQARRLRRPLTSAPTIRSASIPNDPNGQDDVVIEGDDLHLPIGKPVKVLLRSIDVLHDFYVPEFRAKMDMMPGLGHLLLVHADPDRHLRGPVRRTVRHRPSGRCAAWSSSTSESDYQAWLRRAADLRAAVGRRASKASCGRRPEQRAERSRQERACGDARHGRARLARAADERGGHPDGRCHSARESTPSRPPKSRRSNSTIRTAGGRNTSSRQDAKVIAIQYSITALAIGLVALVLSWLMRLQLGFPGTLLLHRRRPVSTSSSPCTA